MKKMMKIGTLTLMTSLAVSSAFGAVSKATLEARETKSKEISREAFPGKSVKGLKTQELDAGLDFLSRRAGLDNNTALAIKVSIKSDASRLESRTKTFQDFVVRREVAKEQGDKMGEALADAAIKYLSNASLHVSPASKKLEEILPELENYPVNAQQAYARVMADQATLITGGHSRNSDDALESAIARTQKQTKEQAKQTKEKLEKCNPRG